MIILARSVDGFFCSFIYGSQDRNEREKLCFDLSQLQTSDPWITMGDFKTVLKFDERVGSVVREHEVQPFRDCVLGC